MNETEKGNEKESKWFFNWEFNQRFHCEGKRETLDYFHFSVGLFIICKNEEILERKSSFLSLYSLKVLHSEYPQFLNVVIVSLIG